MANDFDENAYMNTCRGRLGLPPLDCVGVPANGLGKSDYRELPKDRIDKIPIVAPKCNLKVSWSEPDGGCHGSQEGQQVSPVDEGREEDSSGDAS